MDNKTRIGKGSIFLQNTNAVWGPLNTVGIATVKFSKDRATSFLGEGGIEKKNFVLTIQAMGIFA